MTRYFNSNETRSPPARVLPPSSRGTRCSANATGQSSRSADRPAHLGCSAKRSKSHLRRGWPAAIKQVALRSARVPLGVTRATRLFFFPPELLEALGPAAVVLVQPVADRVLLVEVLVVLLGRIELRGGHDLGDDRSVERRVGQEGDEMIW